jgi:hypothetical protein
MLLIDNLLITSLIPSLLFEYFRKVLIDIINNIKGGIIDFSVTNNRSVKCT